MSVDTVRFELGVHSDFMCLSRLFSRVMSKLDLVRRAAEAKARESAWVPTDTRAQMAGGGAGEATNVVVGLVVASLMASYLLPLVINELMAVDTANWTGGASELWNILPVMIVLAIFLFFVGLALTRSPGRGGGD